jgi:hypothetical protein
MAMAWNEEFSSAMAWNEESSSAMVIWAEVGSVSSAVTLLVVSGGWKGQLKQQQSYFLSLALAGQKSLRFVGRSGTAKFGWVSRHFVAVCVPAPILRWTWREHLIENASTGLVCRILAQEVEQALASQQLSCGS